MSSVAINAPSVTVVSGQQVNKSESMRNKTLVALALAVACGILLAAACSGVLPVAGALLLAVEVAAAAGIGYAVGVTIGQAHACVKQAIDRARSKFSRVQCANDLHALAKDGLKARAMDQVNAKKAKMTAPGLFEQLKEKQAQRAPALQEYWVKTEPKKRARCEEVEKAANAVAPDMEGIAQPTAPSKSLLNRVKALVAGAIAVVCGSTESGKIRQVKQLQATLLQEREAAAVKSAECRRIKEVQGLQAGFVQELNELKKIVDAQIESEAMERLVAWVEFA